MRVLSQSDSRPTIKSLPKIFSLHSITHDIDYRMRTLAGFAIVESGEQCSHIRGKTGHYSLCWSAIVPSKSVKKMNFGLPVYAPMIAVRLRKPSE